MKGGGKSIESVEESETLLAPRPKKLDSSKGADPEICAAQAVRASRGAEKQ